MSELKINGYAATPAEWAKITSVLMDIQKDETMKAVEDGDLTAEELVQLLSSPLSRRFSHGRGNVDTDDLIGFYDKYLDTPQYDHAKAAFFNSRGFAMFAMEECYFGRPDTRLSGLVDNSFLNDRDFVLRLVSKRGSALQFVNDKFKKDKEIVAAAIENDAEAVKYVDPSFEFSRKYLITALRKNGELLKGLSDEAKNDSELVLAAIDNDPVAIKYASPALLESKAFLISTIEANCWALEQIKEKVQDDRDIAVAAATKNGWTLRIFSEALQKDKGLILLAVASGRGFYDSLSEEMKQDRDIALAVVKSNGKSLENLSPELKKDRSIVLAAVENFGMALEYADDSLKNDEEIVLTASGNAGYYSGERRNKALLLKEAKTDSFAFAVAADNLKNDISFSVEMAQKNLNVFRFMTKRQQVAYWNFFVEKFNERLSPFFTNEELNSYDTFVKAMENKYDVTYVRRLYGLDTLTEVLGNLDAPVNTEDARPKAVLIYNRNDWNGGFEYTAISSRLIELGYRVLYYEVDSDEKIQGKLATATGDGAEKADLIVFGGHGTATSLNLGDGEDQKYNIDVGDYKNGDKFGIASYLKENGQIVLDACSTGAGKENDQSNLANTVASYLPDTAIVQAATVDTSIERIEKSKEGIFIKFWKGGTYQVTGPKAE